MAVKLSLALGLAISVLAMPKAITFLQRISHFSVQQHQQSLTGEVKVEPDHYEMAPECDPVNDPSSCRSS
ncbi:hypothetical protein [Thermocoleostomius sinensis]|jgi:hypothetical protein|uniref:Uncharacterized protein n=1 Tax=Thermocoleostomius sinensis A174 TaxID=2016057 RepID=A0A9E9CAB5_9CYAN|nr:hypothetical protein [Thermocoleostomius sinensis]WAL58730.1 hypothetical protein OXH18_16300 [Thermocoleostomius sinensis A174]